MKFMKFILLLATLNSINFINSGIKQKTVLGINLFNL
jgi:hypothetical protein